MRNRREKVDILAPERAAEQPLASGPAEGTPVPDGAVDPSEATDGFWTDGPPRERRSSKRGRRRTDRPTRGGGRRRTDDAEHAEPTVVISDAILARIVEHALRPDRVPSTARDVAAVEPVAQPTVQPVVPAPPVAAAPEPRSATSPSPRPHATTPTGRIGERLVARGQLSPEQLDHAVAEQIATGGRLGDRLIELGAISEHQLVQALADQLGLPVADLTQIRPDTDAVARFPEELARRYNAVPLCVHDGVLDLAVSDLVDDDLRATLEQGAGCPIRPFLAPPTQIREAISRTYLVLRDVAEQVLAFEAEASTRRPREAETSLVVDERAPVVQVVTLILMQALRDRASDIHIEPRLDRVLVRFRVDGTLREAMDVPAAMAQSLVSRIKVMADMNIVERRRSQDGQLTVEIDGRPVDIRVATTATIFGEKAVLRVLDKTVNLRALPELGMAVDTSASFSKLLTSPFGMVICAGPTGSGKTTTLYAGLTELADPTRNVTTIEDPVEYVLPSINQIQVNAQAGITFADGLKAILRQDPDVILVGEMRDVETARIAMRCALTGHFVLSSLHATDSPTALQRFRDMGIEPFLITSSVLAVVSQRLLRRICAHCREPYEPSQAERAFFEERLGHGKDVYFRGAGCNLCSNTGYADRVGIYELLRVSDTIKELLLANAPHDELRAVAVSEGMRPLRDEALRLVDADVTTIAEAARTGFVE